MGYNRENYQRIRELYKDKYKTANDAAEVRSREVERAIPGLAEIDRELETAGMQIMKAATEGTDYAATVAKIRARNLELQNRKKELLTASGYPADYTEVRYECEKCGDSGFRDGRMCECMRRDLILAGYESSGMAKLLANQNFENFSLDYYRSNAEVYDRMTKILSTMRDYAVGFHGEGSGNLLLVGGTGLGKTHLSSATAKIIIERGYDVFYTSALNLISDFEFQRFGSSVESEHTETARYFDCDLLIIDDLGSEMINQFTVSVLYNIVNTRLNTGKPVIASTNMEPNEFRQKYWDRLTSRFFGEYRILKFLGVDIRMLKMRKQTEK